MLRRSVSLLVCAALGAACGEESGVAPAPSDAAPATLSPIEAFDGLLRGVTDCAFDAKGNVDAKCPGAMAFADWGRRNASWLEANNEQSAAIARRYLDDRSPAIRSVAIQMLAWRVKRGDATSRADVERRAAAEKDHNVMKAIVDAAASAPGEPSMLGVLTRALDSEAELVRRPAIKALLPGASTAPPSARVLEVVHQDASPALRRLACERLRPYADANVKATFERVLTDPATDAAVFDGCFYGLTLSWAGRQGPAPDAQAYERWLKLVQDGPRDARRPHGLGLHATAASLTPRPDDKAYVAWLEQTRGFLKREQVIAAIKTMLLDEKAWDDNRAEALMSLRQLGVADAELGLSAAELDRLSKHALQPAAP